MVIMNTLYIHYVIQLLEQTDPPSGDWSLSLRITKLLTDAQLQCEDIYINAD